MQQRGSSFVSASTGDIERLLKRSDDVDKGEFVEAIAQHRHFDRQAAAVPA